MKISQALKQLEQLLKNHGDVEIVTDCEFCGRSTLPTTVAVGPPVVKLTTTKPA